MSSATALRHEVKRLYKTLIHLGKDYPKGEEFFRSRCHAAFMRHKNITDPDEIRLLISRGEYIVKELEALYMLKKYRTLRKRYGDD